tara:strand:- start:86 stop:310 length:225 start_codon:yes stop_codon:yes gene_type:complete
VLFSRFYCRRKCKTITVVSHISGDKESTDIDGSLVLDKSWIIERQDLTISYVPEKDIGEIIGKWLEKRNEANSI